MRSIPLPKIVHLEQQHWKFYSACFRRPPASFRAIAAPLGDSGHAESAPSSERSHGGDDAGIGPVNLAEWKLYAGASI